MDGTLEETSYGNVASQATEFGFEVPTAVSILPRNFMTANSADELVDEATAPTIRQLWRIDGIEFGRFDSQAAPFATISEHAVDWIAPIVFVSASAATGNEALANVALGVIANYVTDMFRKIPGRQTVRLEVVVEVTPERKYTRLTFEGDAAESDAFFSRVDHLLAEARD